MDSRIERRDHVVVGRGIDMALVAGGESGKPLPLGEHLPKSIFGPLIQEK